MRCSSLPLTKRGDRPVVSQRQPARIVGGSVHGGWTSALELIVIELNAQTGKLIWQLPVGVHSGPGDAGLLTEHTTPTSPIPLPTKFSLEPGVFGGVESQLASNRSTTVAAVNNLAVPMTVKGVA
jgi:hypothetical protein